jgi:hypothetical protein
MIAHTSTTLSNGLRIANFSSPHPFTFTDGSVLPAVDDETAKTLMLEAVEKEYIERHPDFSITNVEITWKLTDQVNEALEYCMEAYEEDRIDIVLVPLPILQAMKEDFRWKKLMDETFKVGPGSEFSFFHPFRVIRTADRITKQIHIDKFCI